MVPDFHAKSHALPPREIFRLFTAADMPAAEKVAPVAESSHNDATPKAREVEWAEFFRVIHPRLSPAPFNFAPGRTSG
jgi:hypothetical protein